MPQTSGVLNLNVVRVGIRCIKLLNTFKILFFRCRKGVGSSNDVI